ncbi:nitrite reductase [Marasmius fiardii PR-910]|nr:nitrite reductase [Marasmius fiardii PR-910]
MTAEATIFVVGLGMVGIAFIEKLLSLDEAKRYRIVTCGEESHFAYNRVALTEYFQHRSVEKLYLNPVEWYSQQGPERFEFHIGETCTFINTEAHTVVTDKGHEFSYDYCVLAQGSNATLPSYADLSVPGVFVYRNISDINSLLNFASTWTTKSLRAIIIGGGLLGLEAAKAVYELDTVQQVSIIIRGGFPLSRQLDDAGGEIVLRHIREMGVSVLTQTSVKTVCVGEGGLCQGLKLDDGQFLECDVVVFAIGITPRDELARASGITCAGKGGVIVDDALLTSAKDVYAIGECASWNGNTYGLIAPGIEMADILSFNMTQEITDVGSFKPRKMNNPDLSTKLKLMGVDVASFGDFFAEQRQLMHKLPPKPATQKNSIWPTVQIELQSEPINNASAPKKRHSREGTITTSTTNEYETVTYRDPFAGVYKKYIFSADGKYLIGGMMVGDTSDYVKLVAIVKKKKPLDVPPSQFILGSSKDKEDDGADLDDDTTICSCHNVTKGAITKCIQTAKDGAVTIDSIKKSTKAGTGCGGCLPLITNILKSELKKSGHALSNHLCPHFPKSRRDVFDIVRVRKLQTFEEVLAVAGTGKGLGCEVCRPAVASILSSLWNEHIMKPVHHQNQDTNDKFLANIQRNGTFSVVPRVAGGEITPEKLIVLGTVAQQYNLYTKITGGQRIDLFGAQKADLPLIWGALIEGGFESGHAYGKSLRTVKSCVGTDWCRYGIGDSVGMAIQLEERYKGVRSPHKIKGGVSGCVRECAEAQSKDFGLIATDKGWNVFVCGNGGANPRHATLLASDVPPSKVVKLLDRFLMYYIRTADRLTRTARWLEELEGGIDKLRKVIIEDELGICAELEADMNTLVGTYFDEWKAILDNPEARGRFKQFVNTDERQDQIELIEQRGQRRPANWPKAIPPVAFKTNDIASPKDCWSWKKVARCSDLGTIDAGVSSIAVKYGDSQLAIFHVPSKGYYATQQMCPHKRAFILEHGIVGDDPKSGEVYVSCPMHKKNFGLSSGTCLNDDAYSILTFDTKAEGEDIYVLLPEESELDGVIGTSKWMIKQATAQVLNNGAEKIEIVGPVSGDGSGGCGGGGALEW